MSAPAPRSFRILLPHDGSALANQSITYAALLPATEILVLHIRPDLSSYLMDGMVLDVATPDDEIRAEFETLIDPLRRDGREVRLEIDSSGGQDVADAIITASEGYDLVLMTTHGRGMAERVIFGSVTDRVTRHGHVPTLLLRGQAGATDTPTPAPARIVVPLDGSELAARALPAAADLARILALPRHLVRVVDLDGVRAVIHRLREAQHPAPEIRFDDARAEAEREAGASLDTHAAALRDTGLEVDTKVLSGTVSFALIDAAKPDDLMVMTSHGQGGLKRWLIGSIAEKLIRQAPCPVLMVPVRPA